MKDGSTTIAEYNYDKVGNRLNPPASPDMVYNDADQLTEWPTQHKYTYLVTGSLAQQQNSNGTEVEKEYTYTYRNLLSTVTHYDVANDPVSSMQWDADGRAVPLQADLQRHHACLSDIHHKKRAPSRPSQGSIHELLLERVEPTYYP